MPPKPAWMPLVVIVALVPRTPPVDVPELLFDVLDEVCEAPST
jgi:hypothetical protein